MTNPAAINVFSVLGAPGIELSHLTSPAAAGQAIDGADVLSADAAILFEETPEHFARYLSDLEKGRLRDALAMKAVLSHRVSMFSDNQWERKRSSIRCFENNDLNRFAAAVVNIGIAHRIQDNPTLDNILAKEPPPLSPAELVEAKTRWRQRSLSVQEKLKLQIQLHRLLEANVVDWVQRVTVLREGDTEKAKEIWSEIRLFRKMHLPTLRGPSNYIFEGAEALLRGTSCEVQGLFKRKRPRSWREQVDRIRLLAVPQRAYRVAGQNGFYSHLGRTKWQKDLVGWLKTNAEHSVWEKGRWKLTLFKEERAGFSPLLGPYDLITWPPDPNSRNLQALLKWLGWKMEIQPADEFGRIILYVDFGNWTIGETNRKAEDPIALGFQLARYMLPRAIEIVEEVKNLIEGDLEALRTIGKKLHEDEIPSLALRFPRPEDPAVEVLINALRGTNAILLIVRNGLNHAVANLKSKKWDWGQAINYVRAALNPKMIQVDTRVSIPAHHKDLAKHLIYTLKRESLEEHWDNGEWVLSYLPDLEVSDTFLAWPPNPTEDAVLQNLLGLLGWKMVVEHTDETIKVRVLMPQ
ncbi:MAG: hypothetical protein HY609_06640 [Deltaproteobacteria bacterium]|nr:hypothetical protein [Deltaproteobacteria bacterium]MBI4224596.1 hypothetical protein [Deltaproteobacteria bacterium]